MSYWGTTGGNPGEERQLKLVWVLSAASLAELL
jgi:hypothetical protein